jgi:inorganic pyrophosphatase
VGASRVGIYKEIEPGESTDVGGWQGRAAAEEAVNEAFDRAGESA